MRAVLSEPLLADDALPRVLAFSRRFGRPATALAMHAALPLGLSPELVHLLRVNFVPDAPFIAEADLLLSPLCREVGGGTYEMDAGVRELLLGELGRAPGYGPARVRAVAELLALYAERELGRAPADADAREHLRVQQWAALSYLEPERAAEALARELEAGVRAGSVHETMRVVRLTGALATPLLAQVELMRYVGAVRRAAAGDAEGAARLVPASGAGPVIGAARLPAIGEVVSLWSGGVGEAGQTAVPIDVSASASASSSATAAAQVLSASGVHRVAKVLVLGDRGVGKSTLISYLVGDPSVRERITAGVDPVVRWVVQAPDAREETREIAFREPLYSRNVLDYLLARDLADAAAVVIVVAGAEAAASATRWLARIRGATAGSAPPGLLVANNIHPRQTSGIDLRLHAFAFEPPIAGLVDVDMRSRQDLARLSDQLSSVIEWDGQGYAASREQLARAEQKMLGMSQSFSVVSVDEDRLRADLLGSSGGDIGDLLRCVAATTPVHIVTEPTFYLIGRDAYVHAVTRILQAMDDGEFGLPSLETARVRAAGEREGLADVVLEEMVRRRWAYRVETQRGERIVVPSHHPPKKVSLKKFPEPERIAIEAKWNGAVRDAYVLLLVHLADHGQIEHLSSTTARIHRPHDWVQVEGRDEGEVARLTVSGPSDMAGVDELRLLVREKLAAYLPYGTQVGYYEPADPEPSTTQAQPETPPAPTNECVVILPFGRMRDRGLERTPLLDWLWTGLFAPAVEATRTRTGETLDPVRLMEIPEPGSRDWELIQRALVVVVDVSELDAHRLRELGLLPGMRTQHVVLFRDDGVPLPAVLEGFPCETYEPADPIDLATQIHGVASALRRALDVPSTSAPEENPEISARLSELLAEARKAEGAGDLDAAIQGYTEAVGLAPGDAGVLSELTRFTEAHAQAGRSMLEILHVMGWIPAFREISRAVRDDAFKADLALWVGKRDAGTVGFLCENIHSADQLSRVAWGMVEAGYSGSPELRGVLRTLASRNQAELRAFTTRLVDRNRKGDAAVIRYVVDLMSNMAEVGKIAIHFVEKDRFEEPVFGEIVRKLEDAGRGELRRIALAFVRRGVHQSGPFKTIIEILITRSPQRAIAVLTELREKDPAALEPLYRRYVASGVTGGNAAMAWLRSAVEGDAPLALRVTAEVLKMRDGPGVTHRVVAQVPRDARLEKLEELGEWVKARTADGKEGWISSKFVAREAPPPPAAGVVLRVTAATLNMRAGPGTEHHGLGSLARTAQLEKLEESGGWVKVKTADGRVGWVSAKYVEPVAPARSSGVVLRAVVPSLHLHHSPSSSHAVLATLRQGARVTLLEEWEKWAKVRTEKGVEGWIWRDHAVADEAAPGTSASPA